jgi:hypothetical protein
MLGPIIVSFVAVGLPVVAGIWLAPKQDGGHGVSMLVGQCRDYLRSVMIAAQAKMPLKQLPAGLRYSSTFDAD